jgi:hypothetical protein
MEGGARVWGVQGGETVAGEGGALSVSRSCRRAGLSLPSCLGFGGGDEAVERETPSLSLSA